MQTLKTCSCRIGYRLGVMVEIPEIKYCPAHALVWEYQEFLEALVKRFEATRTDKDQKIVEAARSLLARSKASL